MQAGCKSGEEEEGRRESKSDATSAQSSEQRVSKVSQRVCVSGAALLRWAGGRGGRAVRIRISRAENAVIREGGRLKGADARSGVALLSPFFPCVRLISCCCGLRCCPLPLISRRRLVLSSLWFLQPSRQHTRNASGRAHAHAQGEHPRVSRKWHGGWTTERKRPSARRSSPQPKRWEPPGKEWDVSDLRTLAVSARPHDVTCLPVKRHRVQPCPPRLCAFSEQPP